MGYTEDKWEVLVSVSSGQLDLMQNLWERIVKSCIGNKNQGGTQGLTVTEANQLLRVSYRT